VFGGYNEFEEFRISKAMEMKRFANVSVIERALPPIKSVSPELFLNIVLYVVLSAEH
jgi:uncharacterized protein involved in exopolysaccharide biosynthesis